MLHANVDPDLPVHVFSHCITGVTPMLKYLVSSHPNSFCSLSDSAFGGVSHRHVKQIQMSFKHSNPLFSSQGEKTGSVHVQCRPRLVAAVPPFRS